MLYKETEFPSKFLNGLHIVRLVYEHVQGVRTNTILCLNLFLSKVSEDEHSHTTEKYRIEHRKIAPSWFFSN